MHILLQKHKHAIKNTSTTNKQIMPQPLNSLIMTAFPCDEATTVTTLHKRGNEILFLVPWSGLSLDGKPLFWTASIYIY